MIHEQLVTLPGLRFTFSPGFALVIPQLISGREKELEREDNRVRISGHTVAFSVKKQKFIVNT